MHIASVPRLLRAAPSCRRASTTPLRRRAPQRLLPLDGARLWRGASAQRGRGAAGSHLWRALLYQVAEQFRAVDPSSLLCRQAPPPHPLHCAFSDVSYEKNKAVHRLLYQVQPLVQSDGINDMPLTALLPALMPERLEARHGRHHNPSPLTAPGPSTA